MTLTLRVKKILTFYKQKWFVKEGNSWLQKKKKIRIKIVKRWQVKVNKNKLKKKEQNSNKL